MRGETRAVKTPGSLNHAGTFSSRIGVHLRRKRRPSSLATALTAIPWTSTARRCPGDSGELHRQTFGSLRQRYQCLHPVQAAGFSQRRGLDRHRGSHFGEAGAAERVCGTPVSCPGTVYVKYEHAYVGARHLPISDIRVFGKAPVPLPQTPEKLQVRRDALDSRNASLTWEEVPDAAVRDQKPEGNPMQPSPCDSPAGPFKELSGPQADCGDCGDGAVVRRYSLPAARMNGRISCMSSLKPSRLSC